MGAFYESIHVRTEDSEAVRKALDRLVMESQCKFLLGPALDGWISVFPDDRGPNEQISADVARLVLRDVFHLIVHDDDIFIYYFYRERRLVDQYNSNPHYFDEVSEEDEPAGQGNPERF